ncbi:MAG: hypothetical protein R6X12_09655 [bacterium]
MTAGPPADPADRLVRLGRLCFADFARLNGPRLLAALGAVEPARLTPLLARHPPVLRALLRADPGRRDWPAGRDDDRALEAALVRAYAFDLLAAKSPALFETLPFFDWDFTVVSRRWPVWRTRLLLAGDSSSITAARCRRAAGVMVVEPCPALAAYTRRKAALAGVRRASTVAGPLEAAVASGGFDTAVVALPAGPDPTRLFTLLAGPALVLALRPGAEAGVAPPPGWTPLAVRTEAGPRPGWLAPGA